MKFLVFYKETRLGILEINEKGQHKYTPDMENVKIVEKIIPLLHEFYEERDWGDPIPFFKNKIDNAKRFDRINIIKSFTDDFIMIREE